jgi:lysophospholipase L1-like esterase
VGGTIGSGGSGPSTGGGGASGTGGAAAGGNGGIAGGGSAGASGSAGAGGSSGAPGFSPCPTTADTPCAVLPLGDSITEGFGSSGGGYRVELFRQALQHDKLLTFVGTLQNGPNNVDGQTFPRRHQGHGGFTIDSGGNHNGISGSITQTALDTFHPHIVLLMIGTNDINGNIDVGAAPTRLGKLIDDITTRAPSALVVVATIIPVANDGTNQKVKTYNAALPAIVSARANAGKHVVLLDNYAAFAKTASYATTLMGDYLHPNDAGYAVLGRSFYDAIGALLPSK